MYDFLERSYGGIWLQLVVALVTILLVLWLNASSPLYRGEYFLQNFLGLIVSGSFGQIRF